MGTVLVTGAAGFIGHRISVALARRGDGVVAIDDFNAYYEPGLKRARAGHLLAETGIGIATLDIADAPALAALVRDRGVTGVVHCAAQAGVRHSLENPFVYERSNLAGQLSVLEACRHAPEVRHLVYSSSSSVYGDRPLSGEVFRETDPVDRPVSFYAATKRACELMSHTYAHLYGIPLSGLRFFTVYGPYGRPDMAYFSFTRDILRGVPIRLFGEGRPARDFTFIDDVVAAILAVLDRPPERGAHRILNVGSSRPRSVLDVVALIEAACGREAIRTLVPMQPGDVSATWADISGLAALTGYGPSVELEEGLPRFVDWYRGRYADSGEVRGSGA